MSSFEEENRIFLLTKRIDNLYKILNDKDFEALKLQIKDSLSADLQSEIKIDLNEYLIKIKNSEDFKEEILSSTIKNHITRFLENDENIEKIITIQREKERIDRYEEMKHFISQQNKNANTTRNAVSNIFILMNLILIGFYVFLGGNVAEKTLITISITHISLSAFMVYIFKASNARISALLSILEDSNKHTKIENFLDNLSKKNNLSSHDVEVIKIYLTNRAEREKQTLHPYEMIFKGVNNSSIQFKGGKIEIDKK